MKYKIDWPSRGHSYSEEEVQAVMEVMRSQGDELTQGHRVRQFEYEFGKYIGVNNCFALMSCAHALDISAMLLNISAGDEVVMPSHTYCATALAFARRGAKIIWADIDPNSLTVSIDTIKNCCTSRTKAIVIVHLYGLMCPDTEQITQFCLDKKIFLIEDCAQALGAKSDSGSVGSFGDIACFSFHAQKNISTLGEGGMIAVKNKNLAAKVPGLRLNGHSPFKDKIKFWLPAMTNVQEDIEGIWPFKSTMSECQAAVGISLLRRLDSLTAARRRRGMRFRSYFSSYKELIFQEIRSEYGHSHHLLPARFNSPNSNRDQLIELLSEKYKIKCIVQYYPLNRYELFSKRGYEGGQTKNTDAFFDSMISFPFSLEIPEKDFEYMLIAVESALNELRSK